MMCDDIMFAVLRKLSDNKINQLFSFYKYII